MKPSPLISVVIPCHDEERYLSQCLDSLLQQTEQSFEVLLVDDASSDATWRIIESYSREDRRFRPLRLSKNSGPSVARNCGIDNARGEYLFFLDGDDFIAPHTLALLLEVSLQDHSDLVRAMHRFYFEDRSNPVQLNVLEEYNQITVRGIHFSQCPNTVFFYTAWNTLFRRSLIERNEIRFNADLRVGEDRLFNLECLARSDLLSTLKNYTYSWRKGQADQLSSIMIERPECVIATNAQIIEFVSKNEVFPSEHRVWLMTAVFCELVSYVFSHKERWTRMSHLDKYRMLVLLDKLEIDEGLLSLPFIKARNPAKEEVYRNFYDNYFKRNDIDRAIAGV